MRKKAITALLSASMICGSLLGTVNTACAAEGGEETTKLSIFINMSWYPVDTFEGKIPEEIKKRTGVDLDVTIATDSSQLGVMIASGELPDLIYTDDGSGGMLSSLSDPNVCYTLDEMTEATGVDFSECENYEDRDKIAQTFSSDGNAYTLLNTYNTQEEWDNIKLGAPGQACIFYRKDLLDAAGIDVPTNMDEFTECLAKVKEAYPDMTPFGLGGYWKFQNIAAYMGVTAGQYNEETGEYRYWSSTDKYKDFLKYCHDLYVNGYVSPEDYAVENEADGHQMAYNNGCVFYSWYLTNTALNQLMTNSVDESAEWTLLSPLGEPAIGDSKGWAGLFVSKNCENVDAAASFMQYLNTTEGARLSEWGIEGDDYTLDEDGVPQFSDTYLAARSNTDSWYKDYNTYFYFGSSAINEIYMQYSGSDEELLNLVSTFADGYKNYPEISIAAPQATSDEGVIKTKLEDIKKKYEAKVIFTDSDEAFEAAYEEYMDANQKTGVDTYNEYMTQKIAEVKAELDS